MKMAIRVAFALLLATSITAPAMATATAEEQYRNAISLLLGQNGSQSDRSDALNLLRSAANQDFVPAQTALGTAYEQGVLTMQDIQQAIGWYTKAANQGDWIAQFALGPSYFTR